MIKKLTALLVVILMIVPMIASCGEAEGLEAYEDDEETEKNEAEKDESPINAEIDSYINMLAEDNDFKGQTFVWCGNTGQSPTREEETGDVASDALYYRQRQVEEAFEIDWVNYTPPRIDGGIHPMVDAVTMDVNGRIGAFDLCYGTHVSVQPLFVKQTLMDMSDFTTLDLEREWWPYGIGETYTINDALYFLTGPIFTSYYEDAECIVFNKQVAKNYGIEGLYDLVYNNKWTFDKMLEVADVIPSNENGSGTYRFAEPNGLATLYAHGIRLVQFDEEGLPYVESGLTKALSDVADKFSVIYGDDTVTVNLKGLVKGSWEKMESKYGVEEMADMFDNDDVLFYFVSTGGAAWLRQRDVEFGVLPIPMGSESQGEYITATTMHSSVYVPKSVKNTNKSDVFLEVMGALGLKYIKPTYYDKILKTRATYDNESKDMIDIICSTKIYEITDFLAVGVDENQDSSFIETIAGAIQEDSDAFASKYRQEAKVVNRNITRILKAIDKDKK